MSNAMNPPVIPGFYFDPERKRYFPATNGGNATESQKKYKKPKLSLNSNELDNRKPADNTDQMYEKYSIMLQDTVEQLFNRNIIDSMKGISNMKLHNHVNSNMEHNSNASKTYMGPILLLNSNVIHQKNLFFEEFIYSVTETGYLFKYKYGLNNVDRTLIRSAQPPDGITQHRCISLRRHKDYIFLHTSSPSNQHRLEIFDSGGSVRFHEYLHKEGNDITDSLCIDNFVCMSTKNRLIVLNIKDKFLKTKVIKIPNIKSDIICVDSHEVNDKYTRLYLGCRSGSIYTNLVNNRNLPDTLKATFDTIKVPNIRSIVSLHTSSSDGIIFISALGFENSSRYNLGNLLIQLDIFLFQDSQKYGVTYYETDILNVVKEQEIFSISSNDRYFIYGTTKRMSNAKQRNVFIYSTLLSDNSMLAVLDKSDHHSVKKKLNFTTLPVSDTLLPMEQDFCIKAITFINCNTLIYFSASNEDNSRGPINNNSTRELKHTICNIPT